MQANSRLTKGRAAMANVEPLQSKTLGSAASHVKILATDVDTGVLDTASRGVYTTERVERMAPERLKRFFLRGSGANAGLNPDSMTTSTPAATTSAN